MIAVISAHAEAGKADRPSRTHSCSVVPTPWSPWSNRHQQASSPPTGRRPTPLDRHHATRRSRAGSARCHLGRDLRDRQPGEARRLACDADLIRAVLGSESAILDLGRQKRLFCGELCRVVERDGRCVFPAGDRPPRDCDAHHIPAAVVRWTHQAVPTVCCSVHTTTAPSNPIRTPARYPMADPPRLPATTRADPAHPVRPHTTCPTNPTVRRTRPAQRLRGGVADASARSTSSDRLGRSH